MSKDPLRLFCDSLLGPPPREPVRTIDLRPLLEQIKTDDPTPAERNNILRPGPIRNMKKLSREEIK